VHELPLHAIATDDRRAVLSDHGDAQHGRGRGLASQRYAELRPRNERALRADRVLAPKRDLRPVQWEGKR
jgi:hypothetical protein